MIFIWLTADNYLLSHFNIVKWTNPPFHIWAIEWTLILPRIERIICMKRQPKIQLIFHQLFFKRNELLLKRLIEQNVYDFCKYLVLFHYLILGSSPTLALFPLWEISLLCLESLWILLFQITHEKLGEFVVLVKLRWLRIVCMMGLGLFMAKIYLCKWWLFTIFWQIFRITIWSILIFIIMNQIISFT